MSLSLINAAIFQPQMISSFIVIGVLCVLCVIVGVVADHTAIDGKSCKFLTIFELLVGLINNYVKDNMGKNWKHYAPYILTVALYLLFANLSGLFGLTPPTTSWNITIALSLITFVMIQYTGIKSLGLWDYFKSFFSPVFILFPINLLSEFTFPLALSLRLFGNILSGAVFSKLIYGLAAQSSFMPWIIPVPMVIFHAIFDVFFGIIQVVVFVLLTIVFTSQKMSEDDLNYKEEN